MATFERRQDRGRARAERAVRKIGEEIRSARVGAGLSIDAASSAVGLSASTFLRIERAKLAHVSVLQLCLAGSAVGLDVAVRVYPDSDPVRDAGQIRLLGRFRSCLPSDAPWLEEVALAITGDLRAWDAMTILDRRRIYIEAEMRLGDIQALERKLALKRRDGGAATVILVVADTRHNRGVLAMHRESLRAAFPLDTRAVLTALRAGHAPAASGIVVI